MDKKTVWKISRFFALGSLYFATLVTYGMQHRLDLLLQAVSELPDAAPEPSVQPQNPCLAIEREESKVDISVEPSFTQQARGTKRPRQEDAPGNEAGQRSAKLQRTSSLKTAVSTHASTKFFTCKRAGCGRKFTGRGDYQRHVRTHTGERPFICTHADCGRTFTNKHHLTRHTNTHTHEKSFTCTYSGCNKIYTRKDLLATHIKLHHTTKT